MSRLVETFDVFMPFPGENCSLAFFEGMSVSVLQNSSQTDLQAILDDSLFKQLVSSSTIRDQARLRALSHSSGTSSGWLKALPQLGTRRFRQQNFWHNGWVKAMSKMLA